MDNKGKQIPQSGEKEIYDCGFEIADFELQPQKRSHGMLLQTENAQAKDLHNFFAHGFGNCFCIAVDVKLGVDVLHMRTYGFIRDA